MSDRRGTVQVETCPKRIRGYLAGQCVFDTTHARYVWESPHFPAYYVPVDDVRQDMLVETGRTQRSPSRGEGRLFALKADGREVPDAAWSYPDSPLEDLRGLLRFEWGALDHWFEEDEEVHVHPRDPYTRIDVLASSRRVQVVVDGVTVADAHHPTLLFETGLPTRYYLPLTDVRQDLLEPSNTHSSCPYKGTASYYSVRVGSTLHKDLAWYYPTPLLEVVKIAGLVCFYNERVHLIVDGD